MVRTAVWTLLLAGALALPARAVEFEQEQQQSPHTTPGTSRLLRPGDARMAPEDAKSGYQAGPRYPAHICRLDYTYKNFCHHRKPGLYTYPADTECYLQCDEWGKTFVKPCAYGTYWKPQGKEPTYYNRCVGLKHVPNVYSPPRPRHTLTTSVRHQLKVEDPITGAHLTHAQGHNLLAYQRAAAGQGAAVAVSGGSPVPPPTQQPYAAQPSYQPQNQAQPTGPLHYGQLVDMYIKGKPAAYVGSGRQGPAEGTGLVDGDQPQVHNINPQTQQAVYQPPLQPQPEYHHQQQQPQQQQQYQPQPSPQVYTAQAPPPQVQYNRPPAQPLAQRMELPQIAQQQQQQYPEMQALGQANQPGAPSQRVTLGSRYPIVAGDGAGPKQFNLQKQQLLAQNHQLPGLGSANVIPRKNPALVQRAMEQQSQRAQNQGQQGRQLRQRLAAILRARAARQKQQGGGPGGPQPPRPSGAKLQAERRRRLQQWRTFMQKQQQQGGPRNQQGGGLRKPGPQGGRPGPRGRQAGPNRPNRGPLNVGGGADLGPFPAVGSRVLYDQSQNPAGPEGKAASIEEDIAEADQAVIDLDQFFPSDAPSVAEQAEAAGFKSQQPLFDDADMDAVDVMFSEPVEGDTVIGGLGEDGGDSEEEDEETENLPK